MGLGSQRRGGGPFQFLTVGWRVLLCCSDRSHQHAPPTGKVCSLLQPKWSHFVLRLDMPPQLAHCMSCCALLSSFMLYVAATLARTVPHSCRGTGKLPPSPPTVVESTPSEIVEATGWIVDAEGNVELVAQLPDGTVIYPVAQHPGCVTNG